MRKICIIFVVGESADFILITSVDSESGVDTIPEILNHLPSTDKAELLHFVVRQINCKRKAINLTKR